jgi:GntR family transcriptional regulator / MocR family aminotransferase
LELARTAVSRSANRVEAPISLELARLDRASKVAPPPAAQTQRRNDLTRIRSIGKLTAADLLIDRLDRNSDVPLHTQLYMGLRDSILDGRLRQGASMPSTRDLPALLGVSRNTVLEAYSQLQGEGFLEPRVGSGTYVATTIPDLMLTRRPVAKPAPVKTPSAKQPPRLSTRGQRMISAPPVPKAFWRRPEAFYPGLPAFELLPLDIWRKLSDRRLSNPKRGYLGYGNPGGFGPLRMVIAEYLSASRGVRCRPEQVIVVSGSQQGLDLAARVLVDENEPVWIEDPGYRGARSTFHAAGAKVVPVPVDQDGLRVQDGIAMAPDARMAYVTPSHQYPLGHTMSKERRTELLTWAAKNGSWVIEDDYDSDFRYTGRPLPAMQGMAGGDRVIYLGTFSKVLFPSMRLGYMVVPDDLIDAFQVARSLSDRHQSTLEQAILTDFISEGHFMRHVRRSRVAYAERQECMLERLRHEVPGLITASADPAGMSLVGWLPEGVSDTKLADTLAASGIYAPPLSYFSAQERERGALLLGYTGFAPPRIKFGMKKLGAIVREVVGRESQIRRPAAAPLPRIPSNQTANRAAGTPARAVPPNKNQPPSGVIRGDRAPIVSTPHVGSSVASGT